MFHEQVQRVSRLRAANAKVAIGLVFRQGWLETVRRIPSLLLTGAALTGKTHLLLACLHALCDMGDYTQDMGITVLYVPGLAYLDALRATWDTDERTEEDLIARASGVGILLIDDIDALHTAWATGRWQRILTGRQLKGLPTVVSGKSRKTLIAALGSEVLNAFADRSLAIPMSVQRRPPQTTISLADLQQLGRLVGGKPIGLAAGGSPIIDAEDAAPQKNP